MRQRGVRGLTLIEVVTSCCIVGMLAAIAVPNSVRSGLRAREGKARADMQMIRHALERAAADTGVYPDPLNLTSPTSPGVGWVPGAMGAGWSQRAIPAGSWRGPYLQSIPVLDPAFRQNAEGGGQHNGWVWNSGREGAVPSGSALGMPSRNLSSEGTPYNTW